MRNSLEKLKKYVVRIMSGQTTIGSGVLWKPKDCLEDKLYVFTAAHVLKGIENICVQFMYQDALKSLQVAKNSIKASPNYQQEGDFEDVAIIVLDFQYNNFEGYTVFSFNDNSSELISKNPLCMIGFPSVAEMDQSFRLSMDCEEVKYETVDKTLGIFKYKINPSSLDPFEKNESLIGYSGAGIFLQLESENILIGLHKGSPSKNVEGGNLIGVTADTVVNLCQKFDFDIPITINKIDGELIDQKEYFIEEIMEDIPEKDLGKVYKELADVLGQDLTESIEGNFCGYCEECSYKKGFHRCDCFRGYMLIIAVFLKLINENVDLRLPKIKLDKEIPVYFICSEGKGRINHVQLKIKHFVCALKCETEISHRLEENCIIIWGSKDNPRDEHRKCSSQEYARVVSDITRMPIDGLDITTIVKDAKPMAIIHINEIIEMLRHGNFEKLNEQFKEYLEEL